MSKMTCEQKLYFRNQLRDARAVAQQDAEAFEGIIHVLELMGASLRGETAQNGGLGIFREFIGYEAEASPLAEQIPCDWQSLHTKFSMLYDLVRRGRNNAMHEGAFARKLTFHAINVSIILEHALAMEFRLIKHFMVENPVCAEMWQPLSFIRQSMLLNSFSYLPVSKVGDKGQAVWELISDLALSQYLQTASDDKILKKRLTQPLEQAIKSKGINLCPTKYLKSSTLIKEAIEGWNGLPICVHHDATDKLVGILTPFDLL